MNVLPIPALDGGKLFVTLIARLLRKKLSENVEALIYGTGFALLMVLVILITIVDVKRNF
jgi:regulator of sigma E protease